jgi:hypothetical protein
MIFYGMLSLSITSILSNTDNTITLSGLSNNESKDSLFDNLKNNKHFINETVLTSPTDKEIANLVANKIDLSFYTNPKDTDLIIENGNWTMEKLHEKNPEIIQSMPSEEIGQNNSFLITKTIVIDKGAELNIGNKKIFIESSS